MEDHGIKLLINFIVANVNSILLVTFIVLP